MWALIPLIILPTLSWGGAIKASATPMSTAAVKEQAMAVPVNVDLSGLPEKLGSYTATLRWDSRVLKYSGYQPGSTSGFSAPVVNSAKTGEGLLTFAAANPYGAQGSVNILNVLFEVVGSEGAQSDLKLDFSAMAASNTFADLLPFLQAATTGVEQGITVGELPKEFSLQQNYPNPFNPTTRIVFQLPQSAHVSITIFNALGQRICQLADEQKGAGNFTVMWNGRDDNGNEVPAGMYLYQLQAGSFSAMKQMLLVK